MRGTHLLILVFASSMIAAPLVGAHRAPDRAEPAPVNWALAWMRYQEHDVGAAVAASAACALGDVNGDGVRDLLLRAKGEAGARLEALTGPAFTDVAWTSELDAAARLECAPDALEDGIADPLVVLREAGGSLLPDAPIDAAANAATHATFQTIDGATGSVLFEIEADETVRGTQAGFAGAASATLASLEPGASDLFLFVESQRTELGALLPIEELLLSGGRADVAIQLLDAAGEAQGTIEAADAQAQILAHAAVADAESTRVMVLSVRDAVPLDQVSAQVATVAAHAPDGTLLWSIDLEATTDNVGLVPLAGDINGDGVEDLIAQTVTTGVEASASSSLQVLSGADGATLLARASEAGMLAALPLGDVTATASAQMEGMGGHAQALLVITQEAPDANVVLECVLEGDTCWTAELPADALPVNVDLDDFTGDLRGFLDVTGDGIVDVAATFQGEAGARTLQVMSGVDGAIAWTKEIDAEASVHMVVSEAGSNFALVSAEGRTLALSLVDGATGEVRWTVESTIASEIGEPHVDVEVVTDAAGEATTLLLTLSDASVDASVDAEAAAAVPEHVYSVDAATGATTWSGTTLDGAAEPPELLSVASATAGTVADVPAPGVLVLVAAVATAALVLGRRRAA